MQYNVIHLKESFSFLAGNGDDPFLECYLPYNMSEMNRENQKRPCLLICPGGGYSMCSQRESEPIALHFLPEGFNVFVLTYSVAPHAFPTQMLEVAAAMELIYRNAEEWNCNTDMIAIMGFSAGGHLAAHYSTSFDCAQVRDLFPNSKPVNASILCYPVITADPAYKHTGSFNNVTGKYQMTDEEIQFFSCDKNVSKSTPPAFLWHTSDDAAVPVMNSILYAQALAKQKIPFELHIFPHGFHGLCTCDEQTQNNVTASVTYTAAWLPEVKKWLKSLGFKSI